MLQKRSRLRRDEFGAAFAVSRRVRFPGVQVLYTRSPLPASLFRASVVVGKKISPRAVKRNHLRRRIYAHLARLMGAQTLSGDYIVVVLPEAKAMDIHLLLDSVEKAVLTSAPKLPQKSASR